MTKKKIIIRLILIIAVVALVIKGKGLLESRKTEIANAALPSGSAVTVPVVNAEQGTMQNQIPFLAQVLSDKSIKLSTKLAGYVEKVFVEEAQKVKKGEVLVQIDETELQSNIQAVEQQIPSALIYRRYLMKYSTFERMEKAMFSYIKNPDQKHSIMPPQFFLKFPMKELSTLDENTLQKMIKSYLDTFDVKKKLVLPQ